MIKQGTPEWRQLRCGKLGASQIHLAIARVKGAWGASRETLMKDLINERLTGEPTEGYINAAMQWGIDTEPHARSAYEWDFAVDVVQCGFIPHPRIANTGASPDGLVGKGGIEIKCPGKSTHIASVEDGFIAGRYVTQMHWQMAAASLEWVDFISFHPSYPEGLRLWVKRFERDEKEISILEEQVQEFLAELDVRVNRLKERIK